MTGMLSTYFFCAVAYFAFGIVDVRFEIFWNVPTAKCSTKYGVNITKTLLKYNILVNEKEKFVGNKITLIYENGIGQYPHIDPNTKDNIHGGLPQQGNLEEHLEKAEKDIERIIPNPSFDGLGIIDWQQWRPTWDFNWGEMKIYRKRTKKLMKEKNPFLSMNDIDNASRYWWEETTRQWMVKTLELAKKMRPKGRWCFYIFPDCYNYGGKDKPEQFFCSSSIRGHNDRLIWLWNATTALCPSIYYNERQAKYNQTQRIWYLYGRLAEALRVSRPNTPIYPYVNYRIRTSLEAVPKEHFWLIIAHLASLGLDGAVIWGSSNYVKTEEECRNLELYVEEVIGPASLTVSSNVKRCSKTICNDNGLCTWPQQTYTSWKYLTDPNVPVFEAKDITCRCQVCEGRYCDVDTKFFDAIFNK